MMMIDKLKKSSNIKGLSEKDSVDKDKRESFSTKITVIDYDDKHYDEKVVETSKDCVEYIKKRTVSWINVDGIYDLKVIEQLGNKCGLHPLTVEDIINTLQRPKIDEYENYLFIVLKMLYYNSKNDIIDIEQVSLVVGSNFVISFQEDIEGDVFNNVRHMLKTNKGKIRKMGADFLAYSLIDAVVDSYFSILEKLGDRIEDLEIELVKNPTMKTLHTIHNLKREMLYLRRAVWPLREVVSALERERVSLIGKKIQIFLRDVYDHIFQVIDTIETYRDMLSGMLDIYLSSISNRLNEVMKILTIIATIFIPLTFIAGIYGMNFKFMPEINWYYGYPVILLVMVSVSVIMLLFFRKKKWL
ncbi:MAG: magnesium/cobalt transporter CorA [bacterium]